MENKNPKNNRDGHYVDFTDPLAKTVLNSLSAHIAILDRDGVILETNRAWRNFAARNGMEGDSDCLGINYLAICDATTGDEAGQAGEIARGLRATIKGDLEEFLYDYPCHSPSEKHWYYMRAIRMAYDGPVCIVISHEEITTLKLAEESLKNSEQELEEQKKGLEEANTALKVLLKQREADKLEMEKRFLTNIKQMIHPYLGKLKNTRLKPRERTYVDIIDQHLEEIVSPLLQHLSAASIFLTPQEIQIATLVKDGKSSKEIADILTVSETTVHFHRKNLRAKFGLKNQKTNLRSYLMSLS